MAKIKLTKGELKRQRDALHQYERYLPTLQLKKQQLQLEISLQMAIAEEKRHLEARKIESLSSWTKVLADSGIKLKPWLIPSEVVTELKNVAGIDIEIVRQVYFSLAEYDLFEFPLWVDFAIEQLRVLIILQREIEFIEKGIGSLRQELRITSQRVNLFEKVKIPDTKEAIRLIKIYIGDQMANAVGRSKIAKRKIEEAALMGATA